MSLNIDERFRILESELTEFTMGGTLAEDWGKRLDDLGKSALDNSPTSKYLGRYKRILDTYSRYVKRDTN